MKDLRTSVSVLKSCLHLVKFFFLEFHKSSAFLFCKVNTVCILYVCKKSKANKLQKNPPKSTKLAELLQINKL